MESLFILSIDKAVLLMNAPNSYKDYVIFK